MTKLEMRALWKRATQAAEAKADGHTPTRMIVKEHANPFDDASPVVRQYAPVMGGVCGFAYVHFKGNTAFGRWAKATGKASRDNYRGGLYFSVREYGQSYEKKDMYAREFVRVLKEGGIEDAYSESRLD